MAHDAYMKETDHFSMQAPTAELAYTELRGSRESEQLHAQSPRSRRFNVVQTLDFLSLREAVQCQDRQCTHTAWFGTILAAEMSAAVDTPSMNVPQAESHTYGRMRTPIRRLGNIEHQGESVQEPEPPPKC